MVVDIGDTFDMDMNITLISNFKFHTNTTKLPVKVSYFLFGKRRWFSLEDETKAGLLSGVGDLPAISVTVVNTQGVPIIYTLHTRSPHTSILIRHSDEAVYTIIRNDIIGYMEFKIATEIIADYMEITSENIADYLALGVMLGGVTGSAKIEKVPLLVIQCSSLCESTSF